MLYFYQALITQKTPNINKHFGSLSIATKFALHLAEHAPLVGAIEKLDPNGLKRLKNSTNTPS